jgi:SH3-like domain-containing protein
MQKIIILFFFIFFSLLKYSYAEEEYFRTLRNDKVNLRLGPSFDYPIKIFYTKKFLPVLIQERSDNFIKIRDHENNSGWIHITQLSKKKAAIVIDDQLVVFSKPSVYSTPTVILKKGRLCKITKCKKEWCKIKVDKYKGWIKKDSLWGLL